MKGDHNVVQSQREIATQSLLTDGAGVFLGTGIMTKSLYVHNLRSVMDNGTIRRAARLLGVDAETAWEEMLKECCDLRAYVEISAKKPESGKQKLAISGKRSGTGKDDLAMSLMMLITSMLININNKRSALKWFCESRALHFETE
jgi:hypothetical protein